MAVVGCSEGISIDDVALLGVIDGASEVAYKAVRPYSPQVVHRQPYCGKVARIMVEEMATDFPDTRTHAVNVPIEIDPASRYISKIMKGHMFGVVEQEDGPIVFDATWQQFLPRRSVWNHLSRSRAALPRVLVARPADFVKAVQNYGVEKPEYLLFWAPEAVNPPRLTTG